ncbi:MAG: MarR family winged helix-turn-helix transcriptional regulator [Pseudomonadota bacterium]
MTSTKPPIIALDSFWPYQVTVLADRVSRYTLSVVKSVAELNQSQWRVLAAVAEKPGRSGAEVTAITPMDKTLVSRAVHSLIEMGYITKTADRGDKRRSSLTLTARGLACYEQVATKLNATLVEPFMQSMLPDELIRTLKRYNRLLDQVAPLDDTTDE